ncbi:SDR family NAD(P)-dependent oxidoreductase [Actinomadura roseirufa]|uniref:SDR family NAD(P)-dependent oxidoreductase n=1 Tax=Actinomadura roseirufa TaxID=2094049 RepID=UPI001F5E912D|nr:SDR family oxidoreductase [Actinomadura roseirufa]
MNDRRPATPRTAIVTGGGGALGSAIGHRLAQDGVTVVLADIDLDAAERAAAEPAPGSGGALLARHVDMADPASVRRLADEAAAELGGINVIVNNAAIQRRGGLRDARAADWDAALAVNLRGPALLCAAAVPYWERQAGGSVVNIASRVWLSGGPPVYVAAKAGLVGLTRSLATELGPLGVTANAVAPGFVPTEFTRAGRDAAELAELAERNRRITPLDRVTEPADVANAVAFLASAQARCITGEILHVCGGAQLAPLPG